MNRPYLNLTSAEFGPEQFKALVESYEALVEFQEKAVKAKGIYLGEIYFEQWSGDAGIIWDTPIKRFEGRKYVYLGDDETLKELRDAAASKEETQKYHEKERREWLDVTENLVSKANKVKWLYLFYGSCLGLGIAGLWRLLV